MSSIPNETLQHICQGLPDQDLITLCQVSSRFNSLTLRTFFLRHGMSQTDIKAGNITISSASLRGLQFALFVTSIEKLSCTLDYTTPKRQVEAVERLVSRIPPIGKVDFTIDYRRDSIMLNGRISALVLSVIRGRPGTLLIFDHDSCILLVRGHKYYSRLLTPYAYPKHRILQLLAILLIGPYISF
jgi:hypothetical protein